MESFKISDYLSDFNKTTQKGKCKVCSSLVPWTRDRVASHKRAKCTNLSEEERNFFSKRKFSNAFSHDGNSSNMSDDSNDTPSNEPASFEEIERAIVNFFCRSGISFRLAAKLFHFTISHEVPPRRPK